MTTNTTGPGAQTPSELDPRPPKSLVSFVICCWSGATSDFYGVWDGWEVTEGLTCLGTLSEDLTNKIKAKTSTGDEKVYWLIKKNSSRKTET